MTQMNSQNAPFIWNLSSNPFFPLKIEAALSDEIIIFSCFFKAVLDRNSLGWIQNLFKKEYTIRYKDIWISHSKRSQCSLQLQNAMILKFAGSTSALRHIKATFPKGEKFSSTEQN